MRIVGIHSHTQINLPQMTLTHCTQRLLLGDSGYRQKQGGKNNENGDYDQQLNERKSFKNLGVALHAGFDNARRGESRKRK